MNKDAPVGQRFSHVYLDRGEPTADSQRMRRRIHSLLLVRMNGHSIAELLRREMGVDINITTVLNFYDHARLHDVLDSITVVCKHLSIQDKDFGTTYAGKWILDISRIFKEENVGYTVDGNGGVHFSVDKEFERNKSEVIRRLGDARYGAVRDAFSKAHHDIEQIPPDGKLAMRHSFEALEMLFRLICNRAPRLGAAEINGHLKPIVDHVYENDVTTQRAAQKLLNSFSDWVDGVHFYRHGQGTEEPIQPPLEVAVLAVSTGASFLRWMIELDQAARRSAEDK